MLFSQSPLWIANWKWLVILATALLTSVVLLFVKKVLIKIQGAFERRQVNGFIKSLMNQHLETMIAWLVIAALWHAVLGILELPPKADRVLEIMVETFQSFLLICLAYKAADAVGERMQIAAAKTHSALDDQLVPLARKTLKIFVVVFGNNLIIIDQATMTKPLF